MEKYSYLDLESIKEKLKNAGYNYRYNDNLGQHDFYNEVECISIEDIMNDTGDSIDYNSIINEIKRIFSFIDFD